MVASKKQIQTTQSNPPISTSTQENPSSQQTTNQPDLEPAPVVSEEVISDAPSSTPAVESSEQIVTEETEPASETPSSTVVTE